MPELRAERSQLCPPSTREISRANMLLFVLTRLPRACRWLSGDTAPIERVCECNTYSSSPFSSLPFLAGFFFLLLLLPLFLARGCSSIRKISSSVIFLSVWYLLRSSAGGAPSFVIPFLVMAA